jgi:L-asparaginase
MVVFAGGIFGGLSAVKLDAFSPDAFGAPHGAPLGRMEAGVPRYAGPPVPGRGPLAVPGLTARVAMVALLLGDDGALLDLARPRFDGVVIEGFGRGNVPPGVVPAILRWLEAGKPVVLASRCPLGEVGGEYAFEGGGGQLLRQGVLAAGARPRSLARLELLLCLSAGVPYGSGLA